jgi:CubicO group peptidase (beta-lactamase class C family)
LAVHPHRGTIVGEFDPTPADLDPEQLTMRGAAFVVILGFALPSSAQTAGANAGAEVEARIDRVINGLLPETDIANRYGPKASLKERMAHYHTPGVSIAVVNDGRVEWARGFGVKEWGQPEPVTDETIFQAGSISKPIFAMAVMRLVQGGKLDLDQDVNRYLKSWKVPANESWQPRVTLRQLLSHTAGVTVHGFPGYARSEKIPTVVEVLDGRPPVNTERVFVNILPGSQFRYSGGGTTVAQQLVVDVVGRPFPRIMQDLVLRPLGMTRSTYEQPLPDERAGEAATAHPSKNRPVEGRWHVYPEMAAAGLWTTPSDLARAGIDVQSALKGQSDRLLNPDKAVAMVTPGIAEMIGIGFFLSGKGENVRFGHGGVDEGFDANMTFYKDKGLGAVVMLNSNEGFPLMAEIERAIAREYGWPGYFADDKPHAIATATLDKYAGSYRTRTKQSIAVTREDGALWLRFADQPPMKLTAESETRFSATVVNAKVSFQTDEKGAVKSLSLEQDEKPMTAERVR